MKKKFGVPAAVVALLLVLLAELAFTVHGQSLTWDEGDHIFAGYMSLKTHDFGLNPEHPPMTKMVAALPLLPLDLRVAPPGPHNFKDDSYLRGRELLYRNGPKNGGLYSAGTLIFRVRMAVAVFSLLMALLVFLAAREMFGTAAGFVALVLAVTEPNLIAHGAYVTTDATVTCMFFGTFYALYRYVRSPSLVRMAMVGLFAGLALASKHSAILLVPMALLVVGGELAGRWWQHRQESREANRLLVGATARMVGALAAASCLAIFILWCFYGFRYSARPGIALNPTLVDYTQAVPHLQAKVILFAARFHLLPESYLYGLSDVQRVADWMPTYLLGKVYAHGVWFYFPVVLAIKLTIGTMGLLALAIWAAASGTLRKPREVLFLAAPPCVYLLIAMAAQLDIGVRHVLPMFPFLLTFAAGGAMALVQANRRWLYVVAVLLCWHVGASLRTYPMYIAYANEFWGGPSQTHRYLTDSNTDWGQQLIATRAYIDSHHITQCWMAYFVYPFILPSDYGIPCRMLPTSDSLAQEIIEVPRTITGPLFISYADVNGFEFGTKERNPFQSFVGMKPSAVIQDGIAVYDGTFSLPLASAISSMQRSQKLIDSKDFAGAVREAEAAAAIAPGSFDTQLALADALAASGRRDEALAHYQTSIRMTGQMEPSAREQYMSMLRDKIAAVTAKPAR